MLHLTSTKKNQLNTRNIYSNMIFIDEQELFSKNYSNFQQKFFQGSRVIVALGLELLTQGLVFLIFVIRVPLPLCEALLKF